MAFEENVSNPDPMWRILLLDSRLVSKRVPDVCFLRQRKPTSSPKNVEENLLNSYNLTPCNQFSHLRTEVEYVGKELLNSSWKAPGWWLCWWHASPANSKHQARELAVWKLKCVHVIIMHVHTENSPPEGSLVKTWRNLEIPVSDLHCPQLTTLHPINWH